MDDLISREAAIDAFYKCPNIDWTTFDVLAKIKELPSAQPWFGILLTILSTFIGGFALWYKCGKEID